MLADPCYGLHRVRAGGAEDSNCGGEPGEGLCSYDVNEHFHHYIWLTLSILVKCVRINSSQTAY